MTQRRESSSTRPAPSPSATACSTQGSAHRAGDMRAQQLDHLGPPRLPGLRRGAGRPLRGRRRHAGGRGPAGRGQRHRLPGSVLHPLSGILLAAALGALAVRQRPGGRHRRRRRAARQGRHPDIRVLAQGGDGGTVDIGFGCLSGMFERNDDVLYICYDNEAYMNTGVQRSARTPPAARTATTPATGPHPGNAMSQGKNPALIAMAHEIPYVATASVADLHDLEAKVTRAMGIGGARYIHIHVPCPLGWGSRPCDTIKLARLAVESGLFPLYEAEHGEVVDVTPIRRQVPVDDYLRPQKRFAHLFRGDGRCPDRWPPSRRRPTATSAGSASSAEGGLLMEQPFRNHPGHRLQPGQPHRQLAHRAAGLSGPAAALQQRLPGRREHPGLAAPGRGRRLRGRLADPGAGQPAAGGAWPGLLSPL